MLVEAEAASSGQHEGAINSGQQVVENNPRASWNAFEAANGRRLEDIEQAKQDESDEEGFSS